MKKKNLKIAPIREANPMEALEYRVADLEYKLQSVSYLVNQTILRVPRFGWKKHD